MRTVVTTFLFFALTALNVNSALASPICKEIILSALAEKGFSFADANVPTVDELTDQLVEFVDRDDVNPEYKGLIENFGLDCLSDERCSQSQESLYFIHTLTPPNYVELSPGQSQLLKKLAARCLNGNGLTCPPELLQLLSYYTQQCLAGCDELTLRRLKGFLTPLALTSETAQNLKYRNKNRSLGYEDDFRAENSTETIDAQNDLADGLNNMDRRNLVVSLETVYVVRPEQTGQSANDNLTRHKQEYNSSIKHFLSKTRLKELMKEQGIPLTRQPDIYVNGHIYDVFHPIAEIENLGQRVASTSISKTEFKRQANRIIVDLTDYSTSYEVNNLGHQIRQAHFQLVMLSKPGATLSGSLSVDLKPGEYEDDIEAIVKKDLTVWHKAFEPGQISVGKVTKRLSPRTQYNVDIQANTGIRHMQEVIAVLGTRETPIPVRLYPDLDEAALERGLRIQRELNDSLRGLYDEAGDSI